MVLLVEQCWTVKKPSRSDEIVDVDEQLRIANQTRALFDSFAPKRPIKPNRSESDSITLLSPLELPKNVDIPELQKLRSLQANSQDLFSPKWSIDLEDEHVETQYYKHMDSIEKQHHTTGSGFIAVETDEDEAGHGYGSQPNSGNYDAGGTVYSGSIKSNPATNDWVSEVDAAIQVFVSRKPNRSESC